MIIFVSGALVTFINVHKNSKSMIFWCRPDNIYRLSKKLLNQWCSLTCHLASTRASLMKSLPHDYLHKTCVGVSLMPFCIFAEKMQARWLSLICHLAGTRDVLEHHFWLWASWPGATWNAIWSNLDLFRTMWSHLCQLEPSGFCFFIASCLCMVCQMVTHDSLHNQVLRQDWSITNPKTPILEWPFGRPLDATLDDIVRHVCVYV